MGQSDLDEEVRLAREAAEFECLLRIMGARRSFDTLMGLRPQALVLLAQESRKGSRR